MYISHRYKLGFVHIPKTGGTALLRAIPDLHRGLEGNKHGPLIKLPSSYLVFTLVRNPYRRLVSYYRFQIWKRPERVNTDWYKDFYSFLTHTKTKYKIHAWKQIDNTVVIYKYEEIDDAFKHVCKRSSCFHRPMQRTKKTLYFGEYDWKEYLTREAVEWINDNCRHDFEMGGYDVLTHEQIHG